MNKSGLFCVVIASVAVTSPFAPPAHALEPKQCLPMAAMNAALKEEGQRTLIIGNRVAFRDAPERPSGARVEKWVNVFTGNGEGAGSIGYNLEGDKPMGEPSSSMCVRAKFTNIQLFDARIAGEQGAAMPDSQLADVLRKGEKRGNRAMLRADSISTAPDGTVRKGLSLVLQGKMDTGGAWLMAIRSGDESRDMFFMGDTEYTPTGLAQLDAHR